MRCFKARCVPTQAIVSLVGYGAGVPLLTSAILVTQKRMIQRDQKLWLAGHGDSALDNRDFGVRRRFAKLYQVFVGMTRC